MENGARVIKGFILSVPKSVFRLWHRAGQLESQQLPRPTMNQEEELANMLHAQQEMEWQKTLISFCITSGLQIAFHFHQITDSKLDSLHLVCILLAIIFSCLFVSHFINPTKFPRTSKVLGKVAVFLAATVFFITISIPFPPGVKWATWIIYAISSKEGKPGSSLVSTHVRFDSPGKQMSKYLVGPFTLTYSVPVSASETIVHCKNYHLSRREPYSLRPKTWLDDNVLSTISDAISLVKRKMEDSVNWYLPIVFVGNSDDPSKCISFVKKHSTGSRKTTCQIFYAVERRLFLCLTTKEDTSFYLFYN
ncbi:hypothetical protein NC651_036297 [Populus alba x Populus x berolinensis]|nr:hypothetical protein NC651_036297 [Populus alba x Populus x berolinensis]